MLNFLGRSGIYFDKDGDTGGGSDDNTDKNVDAKQIADAVVNSDSFNKALTGALSNWSGKISDSVTKQIEGLKSDISTPDTTKDQDTVGKDGKVDKLTKTVEAQKRELSDLRGSLGNYKKETILAKALASRGDIIEEATDQITRLISDDVEINDEGVLVKKVKGDYGDEKELPFKDVLDDFLNNHNYFLKSSKKKGSGAGEDSSFEDIGVTVDELERMDPESQEYQNAMKKIKARMNS